MWKDREVAQHKPQNQVHWSLQIGGAQRQALQMPGSGPDTWQPHNHRSADETRYNETGQTPTQLRLHRGDLPLDRTPLLPLIDKHALQLVLSAEPAFRTDAITARLAAATLLACEAGLLSSSSGGTRHDCLVFVVSESVMLNDEILVYPG
ncbi:uncharacterized protein BDW70DRAFT_155089 [Aspergillus foveolatus]|uniref:uncharacterized protein n=1 Tax=Aspergillus foveolatus TaxID=210207 RepID=UPI003CCCCBEF